MEKLYKLGLICGRFGHMQLGHYILFKNSLNLCQQTLVLVGSAQEEKTLRNPFSLKTRTFIIKETFPNEESLVIKGINDLTNEFDVNFKWGNYVKSETERHMNKFADLLIFGNDESRKNWFSPEDIQNTSQLIISRNNFQVSATDVRGMLLINNKKEWKNYTHNLIHKYYNDLRNELLEVPVYKKIYDLCKNNLNLENYKKYYKEFEIHDKEVKLKQINL